MLISFTEIPPQGLALEITDQSWFPDRELERHGEARAAVNLVREGERVIFSGRLEVTVGLVCDRCLEPCRQHIDARFRLLLERPDPALLAEEREHSCSREEMDTVFLAEDLVDVAELLAQQLQLHLPRKNLCRPQCRGLCPRCGADLNRQSCKCDAAGSNSPFAALRILKSS